MEFAETRIGKSYIFKKNYVSPEFGGVRLNNPNTLQHLQLEQIHHLHCLWATYRTKLDATLCTLIATAEPGPDPMVKESSSYTMQNSGAEVQPIFPPELERDIFERTARSYPGTGVVLALVSRRVQLW